ncbi:hypothetical protein ACIBP6_23890 [Nonomuraea terrae]|uniref:hypothetical protein n=1 Tax=Nonomuraea terrae TaxID=2530383 RepID=UPI0037BD2C92
MRPARRNRWSAPESTISGKIRHSPAPSERAASSTSSGTVQAYTRERYTPNGLTRLGSRTAQ